MDEMKKKLLLFSVSLLIFMGGLFSLSYGNDTNVKAATTKKDFFKVENLFNSKELGKAIRAVSDKKAVYTQEYLDQYFSGLDDSELILELPGGGFIGGATNETFQALDKKGNLVRNYCVSTDPNSETVAQVKARLLNQPMK